MTRRAIGAGVLAGAGVLYVISVGTAAAGPAEATAARVVLFDRVEAAPRFVSDRGASRPRHRFHLELEGARLQAEDWLHDAGFSLLEERDADGHGRYAVISGALVTDGPVIRLRARVGDPEVSAGLRLRRNVPAIGVTMPWRQYTLEMEGLEEKNLGHLFMATVYRSDPQRRLEYGVALPLAIGAQPSVGALLQLRLRFRP